MINKKSLAEALVTCCYLGKIKYAPGTFGSLVAFPICYIIAYITIYSDILLSLEGFNIFERKIFTLFTVTAIITSAIFIIGTYFTAIYIAGSPNQDPKEVVIDETVGQMTVLCLCFPSLSMLYSSNLMQYLSFGATNFLFLFLLPFVLFRFFDILKPWPICYLDQKIKGAIGVMIDDVAAAIFASVLHYAFVFLMLDLAKTNL